MKSENIQIVKSLALYISPSVGFGFTATNFDRAGLTIPFSVKGKLIIQDRWLVFFQPLGFDIMPLFGNNNSQVSVQYEMLFGGGITF